MRHSTGLVTLLALGSVPRLASAAPCTPTASATVICTATSASSYVCSLPVMFTFAYVDLWTSSTAAGDVVSVQVSQGGSYYCENISLTGDTHIDLATGSGGDIISLSGTPGGGIPPEPLAATGSSYLHVVVDSSSGSDHIIGSWDTASDLRQELYGGDDADIIELSAAGGAAFGEDGDDNLFGSTGIDELHGGADNDYLVGDSNHDMLFGGDGQDVLLGDDGDDLLQGGAGPDYLGGGGGVDQMFGEGDDDYMEGGGGADHINGGDGDDYMDGGDGADEMFGDAGYDTMDGGAGGDTMFGGEHSDMLCGQSGDDVLHGDFVPHPYLALAGVVYGDCDYVNAGLNSTTEVATGDIGASDVCTQDASGAPHWSCEAAAASPSDDSCLSWPHPSQQSRYTCSGN